MGKIYSDKKELINQILESLIGQHMNYHSIVKKVSEDEDDRKLAFTLFCCLNVWMRKRAQY